LEETDALHALIQIAAYTGLRRQVLCSLKVEDLQEDRFIVHRSKFEEVSREFPIHSALAPVFQRLKEATKTEYLFDIEDGERFSHSIGERFRVYKNKKGYGEGKVFHSFRHTVATQLHKAQVPDYVVDLMLGWSVKGGSTGLRTYTKADFDIMKQAIEKVSYRIS
jgi:integrase